MGELRKTWIYLIDKLELISSGYLRYYRGCLGDKSFINKLSCANCCNVNAICYCCFSDQPIHTLPHKRRMLLLLIQFSCNTDRTKAIKADCTVHKPMWCYVTTIFQVLFHFHLDWARNEALFLKKILTSFFSIVHRFSIELNGNCVRMCTKRIKLATKKKTDEMTSE